MLIQGEINNAQTAGFALPCAPPANLSCTFSARNQVSRQRMTCYPFDKIEMFVFRPEGFCLFLECWSFNDGAQHVSYTGFPYLVKI